MLILQFKVEGCTSVLGLKDLGNSSAKQEIFCSLYILLAPPPFGTFFLQS
jgi:hypothetical protein